MPFKIRFDGPSRQYRINEVKVEIKLRNCEIVFICASYINFFCCCRRKLQFYAFIKIEY